MGGLDVYREACADDGYILCHYDYMERPSNVET